MVDNTQIIKEDTTKKRKKSFFRNKGERQVIKYIKNNNIKHFLFYTDVYNLLFILEYGIAPIKDKKHLIQDKYIVWSYLEQESSIGLEFDTSTRARFWEWAVKAKIKIESIATIAIDPYELSKQTSFDWTFQASNKLVYINEIIKPSTIKWMMIKNRQVYEQLKIAINSNNLDIRLFIGDGGDIEE